MNETQGIRWVKENLGDAIKGAIPGTIYTEDWLGGMAYREVGILILKYAGKGLAAAQIWPLMKGDYGHRPHDKASIYHGFSPWQIDIDSFPAFIQSGNWTSPILSAKKAVEVLESKKKYIIGKFQHLEVIELENAVTAAYNTGEGNVYKSLIAGLDVDRTTFNKDYSKEVRRFREIYKTL